MIKFKFIKLQNFMSVGNAPIEIHYNRSKSTLVTAVNGSGKSSIMLDSICFALYGKAYRAVNRPQLINSINQKNTLVEIHFSIDKTNYSVKRGLKPTIFEIYKDGKLMNQDAASRDYQNVLEQNILKMNYRTFTQVVIMGSGNFVPFMRLPAAARREFIEDILDIKIFTKMNVLLKQELKEHQEKIEHITSKIETLKEKAKMQSSFIKTLSDEKDIKINGLLQSVNSLKAEIDEHWSKIEYLQLDIDQTQSLCSDHDIINRKIIELSSLENSIKRNIKKQEENKSFYLTTDICPTCHQSIEEHHKENLIKQSESKVIQFVDGLKELSEKLVELENEFNDIKKTQEKINNLQLEINQHHNSIRIAQKLIDKHNEDIESLKSTSGSLEAEKSKLKEFAVKIISEEEARKNKINDIVYYDTIQGMLKDTGIKTRIIKQYIPIFNKLINQYLQKLDLFVEFTIDENFNEVVKSRHRDNFTYDSFSEGEKQRLDLAMLFTFRDIARLKNAVNCNILILDEVLDASMDAAGVDNFFNIINDLTNTNLFVISHREGMVEKFQSNIHLIKQGNFTVVDKI